MAVKISRHAHDSTTLWPLVGPLLTCRDLHRALGGPVVADDTAVWWEATEGKRCVGFCVIRLAKDAWHIEAAYIVPSDRSAGLHTALCEARDAFLAADPARAVEVCCKLERWQHYAIRGYEMIRQRGEWVWGRRPARPEAAR